MSPEQRCHVCSELGSCDHDEERKLRVSYRSVAPRKTPVSVPKAVRQHPDAVKAPSPSGTIPKGSG